MLGASDTAVGILGDFVAKHHHRLECNERKRLTVRSKYFQRAGSEPAEKFRVLRNSLAHAHPLWAGRERYRPVTQCMSEDNAPRNYIKSRHDDVFALIGSINQDIAKLLERRDVFEQLCTQT